MIFYDSKDKRKKYVRIFFVSIAILIFGLILSLTLSVFFVLRGDKAKAPEGVDIVKSYKYYYTPLNDKKVSITFDDGPNPIYTPQIISILKKYDVPATFFFIGENILKYPLVAKETSDAGYEIGNHTFTHSELVHSTPERLENELRTTRKMIEIATGKTPLFYRPPYLLNIGPDPTINPEIDPEEPLLISYHEGYIPVGADIDPKDWMVKSSKELLGNILNDVPKGHIILLHDSGYSDTKYMMEVLEETIVLLKNQGYAFVPLKELLLPPTNINIKERLEFDAADVGASKPVATLQWFLYTENFLDYDFVNGHFGAETKEALQNWQLKQGLVRPDNTDNPEYGVLGEKTSEAILQATASKGVKNMASLGVLSGGMNGLLQWLNLAIIAGAISFSKYIFWLVIVLIVIKIATVIGLYVYDYFKKIKDKNKILDSYKGGVSVLIPAYNEEENIESSIRSVIKNNYPTKEIIVINDGSTDNTSEVVRAMQAKYPGKIKLIQVSNGGKAMALNIGIKHSKHDVFIGMDADTVFAPNTISHLVKHFGDEKIGAVAGKVETTRSKNFLDIFQSIEYEVGQNIEKKVFAGVNAVGVVPGPVGAWRKSVVIKCGGYCDETLVEDQDLTLAVLTNGFKIIYEAQALAYTETPHTLKDFLKQRFRWIFGSFQCAWKYKGHMIKKPASSYSLFIMPNMVLFSLILPLFYPIVDAMLVFAMFMGAWHQVLITYLVFTGIDVAYSSIALIGAKENWKKLIFVPIQRLYYRQVIYYVVAKSLLRAIEGTAEKWGKVAKNGESQKYYFANFEEAAAIKVEAPSFN